MDDPFPGVSAAFDSQVSQKSLCGNNSKERMVQPVVFKVRVFLDGELVEPSDYPKIVITSPAVDRIVNDIYETNTEDASSLGT